ncbi:HNH endonuclease [Calditrichota bacterium]
MKPKIINGIEHLYPDGVVPAPKRRAVQKRVRYRVLEAAKGRCALCGRTVEEHGIVMTIDHIIPVSKGGKNDIQNLRALCMSCNMAKGSEIPVDNVGDEDEKV